MGVFNRRGELLTPTSDLLANSLDILAGNKGYFRTAIELTKENDGEQVLIVTCSSEAWSRRFANAQAFAELYFRALPLNAKANEMADVCQSEQWKLRD